MTWVQVTFLSKTINRRSVIIISKEQTENIKKKSNKIEVPIWEKANLTLEEAAAYFGIGINKLREITNEENCPFVLWIGTKRLIKRKLFDNYIERQYSI